MTAARRVLLPLLRTSALCVCLGGVLLSCSGPTPDSSGPTSSDRSEARVFHVQLQMSDDKERAAAALGRAQQWWTAQSPTEHPPLVEERSSADPPGRRVWKAPFYRVRLGPFATKEQAETVQDAARPPFSDAFVVPDRRETP